MAETVVKTVENVDRLFSQIVVNGEVHESENYVGQPDTPAPDSTSTPSAEGEDNQGETQESSPPVARVEVTKIVQGIDRLFAEIVVNNESHESQNYVAPTPVQSTPQSQPAVVTPEPQPSQTEPVQGQDVYAVELNNVIHNFIDRIVAEGLADEISARRSADAVLQGAINAITALIPSTASSSNKLATSSDVNVVQASISDIQALIPSQATSQNQLADKDFVNSSIATNTANFLGTYTSLADIEAIQNPTNNDYAYLQTVDSAGNTQFQRYKYSSADSQWHYEYTLNNSSFTAEQWATINSGLTASSVSQQINSAVASEATARDTAIASAVNALDVPSSGGSGKYIESISEVDGKIVPVEASIADTVASDNIHSVTSGAVYEALNGLIKTKEHTINLDNVPWVQAGTNGNYYINIYPVNEGYLPSNAKLLGIALVTWDSKIPSNKTLDFWARSTSVIYVSSNNTSNAGNVTIRYIYI